MARWGAWRERKGYIPPSTQDKEQKEQPNKNVEDVSQNGVQQGWMNFQN